MGKVSIQGWVKVKRFYYNRTKMNIDQTNKRLNIAYNWNIPARSVFPGGQIVGLNATNDKIKHDILASPAIDVLFSCCIFYVLVTRQK